MKAPEREQDGTKDRAHPCPLCRSTDRPVPLEYISNALILQGLIDVWGARFSPEIIKSYFDGAETHLVECSACGLQYFLPLEPGNAQFYAELTETAPNYYNADKWDFSATIDLLQPGMRVLDVACGSGHFLQKASLAGASAEGVDTNPAAVGDAYQRGLIVHEMTIEQFAKDHQSQFDVVTAFQIIEHVSDVNPLISSAVSCLKPGGSLIVTVPNRLRRVRADFEPLDHPPHHVSRWSAAQLSFLAQRHGLVLDQVRYERATLSDCRGILAMWLGSHSPFTSRSIPARVAARLLIRPTLFRLLSGRDLMDRWRLWRMSLLAVMQKPKH